MGNVDVAQVPSVLGGVTIVNSLKICALHDDRLSYRIMSRRRVFGLNDMERLYALRVVSS